MANEQMPVKRYLDMAQTYAEARSGCLKVAVGSCITDKHGRILSFGANAAIPNLCQFEGCLRIKKYGNNDKTHRGPADCRAIHSEVDAIANLERPARDGRIYVTRYPCEACARAIVAAGITEVYYGRKQYISEETEQIFAYNGVKSVQVANWDAPDAVN